MFTSQFHHEFIILERLVDIIDYLLCFSHSVGGSKVIQNVPLNMSRSVIQMESHTKTNASYASKSGMDMFLHLFFL